MAKNVHKSYLLGTSWTRLEPQDSQRKGIIVQNHSTNTGLNIYVAQGEQAVDFNAIELQPSGDLYEDILPPSGEIWAKAASGTPTLTLVLKY